MNVVFLRKNILALSAMLCMFVFLALQTPVYADDAAANKNCKIDSKTKQMVCTLDNPLSSKVTNVPGIIALLIKAAMGLIGAVTLLMFVWGGFQWLTSAGSPERVKKGSQTMVWAAIGLFLVFASYLILSQFTNWLTSGSVPGA